MIKALIVDDEQKSRNIVHRYLLNYVPDISAVEQADSVSKALTVIDHFHPDLVFLDVEMPHQNGFDFILAGRNPTYDVVFITAHDQYAIQAIRFSALDYILKPIDPEELKAAVARYIQRIRQRLGGQQKVLVGNLIANIRKTDSNDFRLAIPSNDGVFFFTVEEIVRLEASKNYTYIHIMDEKPFLSSKTLGCYEELLKEYKFIRTHKSHIINPRHITDIPCGFPYLEMRDGYRIEVSRRRRPDVEIQVCLWRK